MVTLITEHGTFEATSAREALFAAHKARRKAEEAKRKIAQELARIRAKAAGCDLYYFAATGIPQAWAFQDIRTDGFLRGRVECDGRGNAVVPYETHDGYVKTTHTGFDFIGIVESGSGHTLATVLCDPTTRKLEVLAIGIADGVLAFEPVAISAARLGYKAVQDA